MIGDSREDPIIRAPEGWGFGTALKYGAWCRCTICGTVARSTIRFDFYAEHQGDLLTCENCTTGSWMTPEMSNLLAEKILNMESKDKEKKE